MSRHTYNQMPEGQRRKVRREYSAMPETRTEWQVDPAAWFHRTGPEPQRRDGTQDRREPKNTVSMVSLQGAGVCRAWQEMSRRP